MAKLYFDGNFPFVHYDNFRLNPNDRGVDERPIKGSLPAGRTSVPDHGPGGGLILPAGLLKNGRIVYPQFLRENIPIIRQLMMGNPDVSQAIHNMCVLGNPGHKVFFDRNVSPQQVDAMRNHLENKRKTWSQGCAGMDGVINKMISQAMVSGAISTEWVVNKRKNGLDGCVFINPESIYFALADDNVTYQPYQQPWGYPTGYKDIPYDGMKRLNPMTYKYFALNGDTDIPYGFPPYVSILPRIKSQTAMHTNMDFVVDLMGLIGFLEVLIQKPDKASGEGVDAYKTRINALLTSAKDNVSAGMKDGVVAGFKDDHEFKFNSFSAESKKPSEVYDINELQIFSGLKQDATLAGRNYNSSETQITIIFTKLLSELKNIQNLVKANIEYGYSLELMLAGFNFDYLRVEFDKSTLQDDLKYQQAQEIKIRNVVWKYVLGVISLEQAADELDYETPAAATPLVDPELLIGKSGPAGAAAAGGGTSGDGKKATKNKSAKKQRAKGKPQGKTKKVNNHEPNYN